MMSLYTLPILAAATDIAARVDQLFIALLVFSGIIILAVMVLVLGFLAKYQRGSHANRENANKERHGLEAIWVALFVGIGIAIFFVGARLYITVERPPVDATTYFVVAKQWMWKIHQPNGREEINALHVPLGQTVRLEMTSEDAIHSFYVPDFRIKQDVLPSRYTSLWFKPEKAGTYRLRCAEYCGTDHSTMTGWVTVMTPADYAQWLSAEPSGLPQVEGSPGTSIAPMALATPNIFTSLGCATCHVPDSSVRAPRLDGIWNRSVRLQNGEAIVADEAYVRESILNPNAKISAGYPQPSLMPSYKGQITEEQLRSLTQFIASIRDGWPAPTTTPATHNEGATR